MNTWAGSRFLGRLGDDMASIAANLAIYGTGDILEAYNWLAQQFQTANQNLIDDQRWFAANGSSLSPDDRDSYHSSLSDETDSVNSLSEWVSKANAVLHFMGLQPSGLSGCRTAQQYLGLLATGTIILIVAIIVGIAATTVSYIIYKAEQAHNAVLMAQAQNQAAAQKTIAQVTPDCLALVAANQATVADCIKLNQGTAQAAAPPQSSFLDNIPWTTLLLIGGAVFVLRNIFE